MLENLKTWWATLEDRERTILSLGSVGVGIFVIYTAMWMPLSDTVSDYVVHVKSQRALLIYLQKSADTISELRGEGIQASLGAPSTQNILALTQETLSQHQLSAYLKQIKQPQPDQVSLVFEKVSLDQLMIWVQSLLSAQNAKMISMKADRLPEAGSANVTMVLGVG